MDQDKQQTSRVFDRWSSWWDAAQKYNRPVYEAVASRVAEVHLRVLDVGCGTGILAGILASLNDRRVVYGIDLSPAMVEKARMLAEQVGAGRLSFRIGDAESLPFPDGEFDAVVNTLSFHHYPHPEQALKEFCRREWPHPPGEMIAMFKQAGLHVEEVRRVPYVIPAKMYVARRPR